MGLKTALGSGKAKPSYLTSVNDDFEQRYRFMVIAGQSGIGKTEFCAQFPKPLLFINDRNERGIEDLFQNRPPPPGVKKGRPVQDWPDLMDIVDEFRLNPDHGYATIVFESITGFEQMLWDWAIDEDFGRNRKFFMDYSKGPKAVAKSYWRRQFIQGLADIRYNGCHVLLTAHSRIKGKDNPEGPDYTGEVPYCDGETWQQTHGCMETVAMMVMQAVEKERAKSEKSRIHVEGHRQIYIHKTLLYDGKNRWNVDVPIACPDEGGAPASYAAFCQMCNLDPETGFFRG